MAASGTYYIDTSSLSTATAVWTDSALTTKAPDGWYKFGVLYREQSSGLLTGVANCNCPVPCSGNVTASGGAGVYNLNLEVGSTTGAVILYFNPQNIPDLFQVTYDSTTYNTYTSITEGYLSGYIGQTSSDCGLVSGSPHTLNTFNYDNATSQFIATGSTESVAITNSDVNTTTNAPGFVTMVIPKPNASPTTMALKGIGPCSDTAWNLETACPANLTSFTGGTGQSTSTSACSQALNQTYYHAPNRGGTGGTLAVNDFVFSDVNGATKLAANNYKISASQYITVSSNGIITTIGSCSGGSLTSYSSSQTAVFNQVCAVDGSVYPINQTYYHDGSGTYPAAGDHCYIDSAGTGPLAAGYYQIQPSTTGAGNRRYLQITGTLGEVAASFPQNC